MKNTKTALITGGTSGIGFELAKQFANNGYDLVITGRKMSRLIPAAAELHEDFNVQVVPIENNLSDPNSPQKLLEAIQIRELEIDVLVNNAGFATQGAFVDIDIQKELDMIQVNISALTHITKLFLPKMIARGSGYILNIASTAAFQPGPFYAAYFATKAYVLSLSEALAEELRGTGVTVTALCPGPTKTGFADRAGTKGKGLFKEGGLLSAKDVARIGFEGLIKEKVVVITGTKNKLLIFMLRLAPRNLVTAMVSYLQDKRG
jgi:uncharacterized protein